MIGYIGWRSQRLRWFRCWRFSGPKRGKPHPKLIRFSLRQRRHNVSECIPILSHPVPWVWLVGGCLYGLDPWTKFLARIIFRGKPLVFHIYVVYVSLPWAHVGTWNIMEYHGHHGRSFRYMETQVNSICDPGCRWSPRPKETDHPGIGGIFFIPWPERTRCFHIGFWLFQ